MSATKAALDELRQTVDIETLIYEARDEGLITLDEVHDHVAAMVAMRRARSAWSADEVQRRLRGAPERDGLAWHIIEMVVVWTAIAAAFDARPLLGIFCLLSLPPVVWRHRRN